jgi:hypothetical protein
VFPFGGVAAAAAACGVRRGGVAANPKFDFFLKIFYS